MQYLEDQVYKYTENKYCWHHILVVGINFTQYDTILDCADGVSHTTVASQEPEDCGRAEYTRDGRETRLSSLHRSSESNDTGHDNNNNSIVVRD